MAFHFGFEALYRLRQSLEHQQELRLRTANQQVAKVRRAVEQLNEQLDQLRRCSSQNLASGMTAAEMHFILNGASCLVTRRQELEQLLARVCTLRDKQEKLFREARRERETLESLRDQQLRAYQQDQARRQQRSLDDLFLLRRSHLLRG